MGSVGQIITGVVGGIVGFVVSGFNPAGAVIGFSLGFSIGGLIFPPDLPGSPKQNDDFNVTGATEGSAVPWIMGRREVQGNVIYFGEVRIEEITEEPGKGGGGGEYVVETRPFAPIHLTLAVDTLITLHGVYDGKRRDWEVVNANVGGTAFQISTGAGVDFNYDPASSPMPGVTSVFSPDMFLGENARNMTPLIFDIEIHPGAAVGAPTLDLTTGVNPACIYYHILTNAQYGRGLDPALINLSSFQDAYEIYRAEDRGMNTLIENGVSSFKSVIEALNFHTNSILRVGFDGRLELYPLRWGNWTAIPLAEEECKEPQVTVKTWAFVDNDFVATFPDEANNFTQRTLRQKNEAVQEMTGSIQSRTYDFPWFTDINNASRRLSELMEEHSFPGAALAVKVSKKHHKIRPGDVIALTHSNYGFNGTPNNGYFRVLEVQDADFGKTGMVLKARQIREPLVVNYVPPTPMPDPDPPVNEPQPPTKVGGHQPTWTHHRHPPKIGSGFGPSPAPGPAPGPGGGGPPGSPGYLAPQEWEPGFFGYPQTHWAARGSGRDIVYLMETVHDQESQLPTGEAGRTVSPRWAYAFCVRDEPVKRRHHYRDDEPLKVTFMAYSTLQPVPSFGHDNADANGFKKEMETGRWALLIGNTEICHFEQVVQVSGSSYEIYGVQRGANGEYLYEWPVDTPVMIVDTRPNELQPGLSYTEWAFRARHIPDIFYATFNARIRTFFQAVDLLGQVAPPDEGWNGALGVTYEDRSGDHSVASGMYPPQNEILCDRSPMPTCQALRHSFGLDWARRSWYAVSYGYGSAIDWIIEFPPFPDDTTGIGTRVAYDEIETPGDPYGAPVEVWDRHFGPTDAAFETFVGAGAAVNGQTYRLYIMANITENPLVDTPIRTIDITFTGVEVLWPAFVYTIGDQVTDATELLGDTLAFWVAVEGRPGHFCRPRLVDKMGNGWSPQFDPTYDVVPT